MLSVRSLGQCLILGERSRQTPDQSNFMDCRNCCRSCVSSASYRTRNRAVSALTNRFLSSSLSDSGNRQPFSIRGHPETRNHPLTIDKTPTSRRNAQCGPFASARPVRRSWRYCYQAGRTLCIDPLRLSSVLPVVGSGPRKIRFLPALAIGR